MDELNYSDKAIEHYESEPRRDHVMEFRTTKGETLAISVPSGETRVLKHFQQRMPYGLFVPDVP